LDQPRESLPVLASFQETSADEYSRSKPLFPWAPLLPRIVFGRNYQLKIVSVRHRFQIRAFRSRPTLWLPDIFRRPIESLQPRQINRLRRRKLVRSKQVIHTYVDRRVAVTVCPKSTVPFAPGTIGVGFRWSFSASSGSAIKCKVLQHTS
jgi:hypothetical protein